jgi:hypothetical protein
MSDGLYYPLGDDGQAVGPAFLRSETLAPLFRDDAGRDGTRKLLVDLGALANDNEPGADDKALLVEPCLEELTATVRRDFQAVEEYDRRRAAGEYDVPEDEDVFDLDEPGGTEMELIADRLHLLLQALRNQLVEHGYVPVEIGKGPTTRRQLEALGWLTQDPEDVLCQVRTGLFASFKDAYAQPFWREVAGLVPADSVEELVGQYHFVSIELPRSPHAMLVFRGSARWEFKRGLTMVVGKGREPNWLTAEDVPNLEGQPNRSPYKELVNALIDGHTKKAERLVNEGAKINGVPQGEEPPLCLAVSRGDPELVARLLQFGADPGLREPDNRLTPLMLVRRKRKLWQSEMEMRQKRLSSVLEQEMQKHFRMLDDIEKQFLDARRRR